jgi:tight adherence protein C
LEAHEERNVIDSILIYLNQIDPIYIIVVISFWMVVIGVLVFFYSAYTDLHRKKSLSRFGLKPKESKSQPAMDYIESANDYLSSVLSTTDTEVNEKMQSAGIYNEAIAKAYMPAKYILMLLFIALSVAITYFMKLEYKDGVVIGLVFIIAVMIGPDAFLNAKGKAIQKKLSDKLPYLIDMMGICVQTGMTIEASISYLAQEMNGFDKDIAAMLKRTSEKARVVGLEKALEDLYKKVPTPEFRSFVMTLNQSLQYGSSISEVLTNLSMDIREVQMLTLEERVGSLSAKMSVPLIIFIMIPIVILITAPGIMRLMG